MSVQIVPPISQRIEEWVRKAATALNRIAAGHGNYFEQEITLSNGTSTTVADPRATKQSIPVLVALDSAGSALTWYISARREGEFDIAHSSAAGTEKFAYVLHGG